MSNLRFQKRLAASILKCGRRKIWIDPNEMQEIHTASTRTAVRKLIRDGFVIKKPQKVHSRFRARRRAIEKKKGRHLGMGKRKGTRNARNPVKELWLKKQRAYRRVLKRYRQSGKIDRRMYHRFYLKAKGNSFKNRKNLIEHINDELGERRRNAALLEQYKVRREEALRRKAERDAQRKKEALDKQKVAEQAARMVKQKQENERRERQRDQQGRTRPSRQAGKQKLVAAAGKGAKPAKGKGAKAQKPSKAPAAAAPVEEPAQTGPKKRRRRAPKKQEEAPAPPQPPQGGGGGGDGDAGKKRRRRRKGGN